MQLLANQINSIQTYVFNHLEKLCMFSVLGPPICCCSICKHKSALYAVMRGQKAMFYSTQLARVARVHVSSFIFSEVPIFSQQGISVTAASCKISQHQWPPGGQNKGRSSICWPGVGLIESNPLSSARPEIYDSNRIICFLDVAQLVQCQTRACPYFPYLPIHVRGPFVKPISVISSCHAWLGSARPFLLLDTVDQRLEIASVVCHQTQSTMKGLTPRIMSAPGQDITLSLHLPITGVLNGCSRVVMASKQRSNGVI